MALRERNVMAFAVEEIPNSANLFRKIHKNHYDSARGTVSSVAFKEEQMSVNWDKYKTARDSADQNSAAVVALVTKDCRDLGQAVRHTPIEPEQPFGPNQAHAEVCGNKTKALKEKLRDSAIVVWLKQPPG
jgi:hypothetical protein